MSVPHDIFAMSKDAEIALKATEDIMDFLSDKLNAVVDRRTYIAIKIRKAIIDAKKE